MTKPLDANMLMLKQAVLMLLSAYGAIVYADPLANQASLPEIAAYYHTSTVVHDSVPQHKRHDNLDYPIALQYLHSPQPHRHKSHWYLWRQNDKIEILSANKRFGEVWQKRKHNQVALTHLYHTKAFAIRYTYSDLKALNNAPQWTIKSHLVSPALLAQLHQTGTKTVLGYTATTYSGAIDGYQLDIDWIAAIQAPARIRQHHQQKTVEVTLKAIYPFDKAPWQPIDSAHYDDMDYADIGDNESHPVVRSHMNNLNLGAHHHRH